MYPVRVFVRLLGSVEVIEWTIGLIHKKVKRVVNFFDLNEEQGPSDTNFGH